MVVQLMIALAVQLVFVVVPLVVVQLMIALVPVFLLCFLDDGQCLHIQCLMLTLHLAADDDVIHASSLQLVSICLLDVGQCL